MGAEESMETRSDLRIPPDPEHRYFMEVDDEEKKLLEYMVRLCEARPEDGWKRNRSVEGVDVMSCYPKQEDGTSSKMCMIRGELPDQAIDPEFMLGQITSPDAGCAIDPMCIEQRVVHQYDATRFILHGIFKLPPPLAPRDFVFKAISLQLNKRQIVTIGYSIPEDHEFYVKPTKKYVRGTIDIAGYLFTANEEITRTTFTYMCQVDIAGWIPKFLTNLVSGDQASNVARVREALVDFQKSFKKSKDVAISVSVPYHFQFYRIFGMFLPVGDKVYKQVHAAKDCATILWYNEDDQHWRFSLPAEYEKRSDECVAYCETECSSIPFKPNMVDNEENSGDIQWFAKNIHSGEFEPLAYCNISLAGEFIERLGIDKMEFKKKRGWFKRKFGKKPQETKI